MSKRDKQIYQMMISKIEARIREGHPMFGDKAALRNYREKLAQCK